MIKLAVFDIDGTLIKWKNEIYIWKIITDYLSIDTYNDILVSKYKRKKISYKEWHLLLFQEIQNHENFNFYWFEKLVSKNINNDFNKTNDLLCKVAKKINHLAVLSGSIANTLEICKINTFYFEKIVAHKFIFEEDGRLKNWQINPYGSDSFKINGLKELCNFYSVNISEILYIGDGHNDLELINYLHKNGGLGLALPPLTKNNELLIPEDHKLSEIDELIDKI